MSATRNSAWWWVPTLYFAEGIPYFIVNSISIIMFTDMGVPKDIMSLYTSLLYLPWVIKPLWSPIVDILRTKRWWILVTELVLCCAFIGLTLSVPTPEGNMIASMSTPVGLFAVSVIIFYIIALTSATHDIAADGFYMLALNEKTQTAFVGIRSTFYRLSSIFGQGVLVVIAGVLEKRTGDIPGAWRAVFLITSLIFLAITVLHIFRLPRTASDRSVVEHPSAGALMREFLQAFISFFKKKGIVAALAFLLLYRFSEALMLKLVVPFFKEPVSAGGLGLSTSAIGMINGTVGVVALLAGGIAGGLAAARWNLRKCMYWMAAALTLPCAVYVYMSIVQPSDIWVISSCVAFEQFGYGFGFQAYMLFMMWFSEGEFKTSHYAVCTGLMAMSMMIPGLFAGYLCEAAGYRTFFWIVMAGSLLTFFVTALARRELRAQHRSGHAQ